MRLFALLLSSSLLAGNLILSSCALHNPVPRSVMSSALGPAVKRPVPGGERREADSETAQFFRLQRWPEGSEMPSERYLSAKRRAETMRVDSIAGRLHNKAQSSNGTGPLFGNWQSLGPGNVGGRTRGLVIHPNNPDVMWAGGATGGVWKTTDAGQTWNPLTDLLPVLSLSSLVLDPTNPDVLYAGTGERFQQGWSGAGIFKTTDGGQSWIQLPGTATANFFYVNALAISAVNPQRIYAATSTGLWTSADGGSKWSRSMPASSSCTALKIRTDTPTDVVFATCVSAAQVVNIYRNPDAGGRGSWSVVHFDENAIDAAIDIARSNQNVIYIVVTGEQPPFLGALSAVYRSTQGGDPGTWETRADTSNPNTIAANILSYGLAAHSGQGGYNLALAVDPTNSDVVFAGGIGLFRSDDGGVTWGYANSKSSAHSDQHLFAFHPAYDGQSNQTLYVANDGGISVQIMLSQQCPPMPRQICRLLPRLSGFPSIMATLQRSSTMDLPIPGTLHIWEVHKTTVRYWAMPGTALGCGGNF